MKDKLYQLIATCKGSVSITVNGHRDCYESITDYLTNTYGELDPEEDIGFETYKEIIKRDAIVILRFYPHSPVGFTLIYHYDLEMAIDEALESLK